MMRLLFIVITRLRLRAEFVEDDGCGISGSRKGDMMKLFARTATR